MRRGLLGGQRLRRCASRRQRLALFLEGNCGTSHSRLRNSSRPRQCSSVAGMSKRRHNDAVESTSDPRTQTESCVTRIQRIGHYRLAYLPAPLSARFTSPLLTRRSSFASTCRFRLLPQRRSPYSFGFSLPSWLSLSVLPSASTILLRRLSYAARTPRL